MLKSRAVPKIQPTNVGIKHRAVETEDHSLSYADFEGIIPERQYGAGKMEIWNKGTFTLEKREAEQLFFSRDGEKLKGSYVVLKLKPRGQYTGEKN